MNPARSLAPALFAGGDALNVLWLYLVAPPIGAILGALLYEFLRGDAENAKAVLEEPPIKKWEVVEVKKNEEDQKAQG